MTGDPALAVCGSNVGGGSAFSVALRSNGRIEQLASAPGERGDLAVLCRELLQRAGTAAQRLREVRVDTGPGSYVGLRVAVTFARVTAYGADCVLLACDSLAAAALAAVLADRGLRARAVLPALDGRQQRVQLAAYGPLGPSGLPTRAGPQLVADADVPSRVRPGDVVLADAQVMQRLAAAIRTSGAELRPLPALGAATLFAPELPLTAVDPEAVEPLYLTGSYAG